MNRSLQHAIRNGLVESEDELGVGGLIYSVVRTQSSPEVLLRDRGGRSLEEIPPSELQMIGRIVARDTGFELATEEHLRAVLDYLDLKRLTAGASDRLKDVLSRRYAWVDRALGESDD